MAVAVKMHLYSAGARVPKELPEFAHSVEPHLMYVDRTGLCKPSRRVMCAVY